MQIYGNDFIISGLVHPHVPTFVICAVWAFSFESLKCLNSTEEILLFLNSGPKVADFASRNSDSLEQYDIEALQVTMKDTLLSQILHSFGYVQRKWEYMIP